MQMETDFAPAERASQNSIVYDNKLITSAPFIREILNASNSLIAIINEQRQILFANHAFIDTLGAYNVESILGQRPGEALGCLNSDIHEGGCGTSENCFYCGAVNAILDSQKSREKATYETRIGAEIKGEKHHFDLRVVASPLQINGQHYTMLNLEDISHLKRKRVLERLFYHDLLNTAGGISSYLSFVNDPENKEQKDEFVSIAGRLSKELIEEINGFKYLTAAENKEYELDIETISCGQLVNDVVSSLRYSFIAESKSIEVENEFPQQNIKTDPVLLRRVLINMLKNALEATADNGWVRIGCNPERESVVFWVHNKEYIPKEISAQIFQRSFSTKGYNRGLGTYSIKLFTEDYLQGKAAFSTSKEKGTVFNIRIPVELTDRS